MKQRSPFAVASFAVLLTLGGCGDGLTVAPVSGVITLDGAPLAGARINTQPVRSADSPNPGPGSFAVTDDAGRYTLELVTPPRPGAVVGEHIVHLKKQQVRYAAGREDAPTIAKSELPPEALDGSLRITVPPEGMDSADLHLKSK